MNRHLWIWVVLAFLAGNIMGCMIGMLTYKEVRDAIAEALQEEEKADVAHPQSVNGAHFAFQYPGNWKMDVEAEDHDPDRCFSLDTPGSCYVYFVIYEPPVNPEDLVADHAQSENDRIFNSSKRTEFKQWAGMRGSAFTSKAGSSPFFPVTSGCSPRATRNGPCW